MLAPENATEKADGCSASALLLLPHPVNYGEQETQLPGAPTGPYSPDLNDLSGTNPNGIWQLYIYDDKTGQTGAIERSWSLQFFYDQ